MGIPLSGIRPGGVKGGAFSYPSLGVIPGGNCPSNLYSQAAGPSAPSLLQGRSIRYGAAPAHGRQCNRPITEPAPSLAPPAAALSFASHPSELAR